MAAVRIEARGFAIPLPAMSGADPWIGSNIDGVVRSGLKPGEEIVVNGLARVRPGMRVMAERGTSATNEKGLAQR